MFQKIDVRLFFEMLSIRTINIDFARYYNMPRSTAASIIRRYRNRGEQKSKEGYGKEA